MRNLILRGEHSRRDPAMAAFGIEQGTHGTGEARYTDGVMTLPDGSVRAIEEVASVTVRADRTETLDRAGTVIGGLRGALAAATPSSLPLRLAFSTVRAGLGVIEEGIRPALHGGVVEITFSDGTEVTARMPPETAALIRRDTEIARGVLARSEAARPAPVLAEPVPALPEPPSEAGPTTDEALTSIFRYEKRNGRLRRVAVPAQAPEG